MNRYYYLDRFKTDGNVLGPVSIQELKRLNLAQQITEECLVCLEGTEDWEPLAQVIKKYNDNISFLSKEKTREEKKKKRDEKKKKMGDYLCGVWGIWGVRNTDPIRVKFGYTIVTLVNVIMIGYCLYGLLQIVWLAPKFVKDTVNDAKFISEKTVVSPETSYLLEDDFWSRPSIFGLPLGVVLFTFLVIRLLNKS